MSEGTFSYVVADIKEAYVVFNCYLCCQASSWYKVYHKSVTYSTNKHFFFPEIYLLMLEWYL